jgi:hypothetical protein
MTSKFPNGCLFQQNVTGIDISQWQLQSAWTFDKLLTCWRQFNNYENWLYTFYDLSNAQQYQLDNQLISKLSRCGSDDNEIGVNLNHKIEMELKPWLTKHKRLVKVNAICQLGKLKHTKFIAFRHKMKRN